MKIFQLIVLTTCLSALVLTCKNQTNTTKFPTMNGFDKDKKYEWSPTESAPEYYPIEVNSGIFYLNNNRIAEIPNGGRTVQNG